MKIIDLTNLDNSEIKYKINSYPDGQRDITITNPKDIYSINDSLGFNSFKKDVTIKSHLNNAEDLLLIVCTVEALRNLKVKEIHLYTPYIVGARSDRKFVEGGIRYLSQIIAPILNSCKFETVTCIDIHSDVAENVINNLIVEDNSELVKFSLYDLYPCTWDSSQNNFILVSPDAGASKKIYKLAEKIGYKGEIITCSKDRDLTTGKITRTVVPTNADFIGKDVVIVDDICDGGATFINIAKEIKSNSPVEFKGKIYLIVTHGIFSKGFSELEKHFDGIYCTNSYQNLENYTVEFGDISCSRQIKFLNNSVKQLNVY